MIIINKKYPESNIVLDIKKIFLEVKKYLFQNKYRVDLYGNNLKIDVIYKTSNSLFAGEFLP